MRRAKHPTPKQQRIIVWMQEQHFIHGREGLTEQEIIQGVNEDGILKLTDRQFRKRLRALQKAMRAH